MQPRAISVGGECGCTCRRRDLRNDEPGTIRRALGTWPPRRELTLLGLSASGVESGVAYQEPGLVGSRSAKHSGRVSHPLATTQRFGSL
jgi:hypothetical protein